MMVWPRQGELYLLTAEFISGKEAERIGLVSVCVPRAELMDAPWRWRTSWPHGSQPAIRMTKRAITTWMRAAQPAFEASMGAEMFCFMGRT